MNKLYNNVILEDGFSSKPCDFSDTPYLKDRPDVIDVSVGRQLFVDNFLIENTDLTPEYHKAHKYEGNPVLFPEMPWERDRSPAACPKSGGVWYDEEEFEKTLSIVSLCLVALSILCLGIAAVSMVTHIKNDFISQNIVPLSFPILICCCVGNFAFLLCRPISKLIDRLKHKK